MFNRTVTKAFVASVAAGIATFALTPAAHAESGLPSTKVSYADLNLNTDAGVARFKARIDHAADRVCGVRGAQNLNEQMAATRCKARTLANAQRGMVEVIAAKTSDSNRLAMRDTAPRSAR